MTGRRLPRLMYWHPTLKHRPVFERGDQMTDNPCCAHFADTGTPLRVLPSPNRPRAGSPRPTRLWRLVGRLTQTPTEGNQVKRRTKALLAATAVLAATLTAAPAAQAVPTPKSGTFFAGMIYADINRGGQSVGLFFDNVGACNFSGYTARMNSVALNAWGFKVSSIAPSGQNRCNSVRVTARSGNVYYYPGTNGVLINANSDWNDETLKINFYWNGR